MGSSCHRATHPLAEGRNHSHQLFLPHRTPSKPLLQEGNVATELQNPQWTWSLIDPGLSCAMLHKSLDLFEPQFVYLQNGQQELKHYTTVSHCYYFHSENK